MRKLLHYPDVFVLISIRDLLDEVQTNRLNHNLA